jgi:hypothetical protein
METIRDVLKFGDLSLWSAKVDLIFSIAAKDAEILLLTYIFLKIQKHRFIFNLKKQF